MGDLREKEKKYQEKTQALWRIATVLQDPYLNAEGKILQIQHVMTELGIFEEKEGQ